MRYQPIDRYGVIGDCETVALVAVDGSIDFMCFPYFDSPSIFARLLDGDKGGSFQIHPRMEGARGKQIYLPDTNILFTRFLSGEGVAEISDFMAVEDGAHRLVRRVKAVRGDIGFRMVCAPRMNYARDEHEVTLSAGGALFVSRGGSKLALRLRTIVPLQLQDGAAVAEFMLRSGHSVTFMLEDATRGEDTPSANPYYTVEAFKTASETWRRWVARSTYRGRWREIVNRSALTLKLLTSRTHGSIIAAPTFGLPEEVGGERNWDYRYTWIRDGSFTLYGLMRLGYTEEAGAFMRWFEARCAELNPDGSLQIMYGIDGRHTLDEVTLDHLEGYTTPPTATSSSTSTASSWTRCTSTTSMASRSPTGCGRT